MHCFSDIVGLSQVKHSLKNALVSDKPSHAYILFGMQGVGKKMIANAFAKALQCTDALEKPCGNCESCRAFDSGNHPDVLYLGLKDKKSLGVSEIREQLVLQAASKQYKYRYKIFIVDDADTMTVAAQNALLKTLEEPPYYVVILLLAENKEKLLPTILSRGVSLPLRPLSAAEVSQYLKDQGIADKKQGEVLAALAQGSIGKAVFMAQSESFATMREDIISKLLKIPRMNMVECMAIAKELEIYKDSLDFLDMIYLWYRDLLAAKSCKDVKFLIQKDQAERLFLQSEMFGLSSIQRKLAAVWQARGQLSQNAAFQSVMEVMLIKLKES